MIIGSGVRMQKVYNQALKIPVNSFEGKKVAIFLSSKEAGEAKSYDQAIKKYIQGTLEKYPHVQPVAAEAFRGRMKILGKVVG